MREIEYTIELVGYLEAILLSEDKAITIVTGYGDAEALIIV
jgi:hypothetical protein